MKEILELPVFSTEFKYGEEFFKNQALMIPNGDQGYKYIAHELADQKQLIYFLLEIKDNKINRNLFDRLIPRAPLCLMLLMGETFLVNNFYEYYKERFNTPLICLAPQPPKDFDLTYVKNVILQNAKNKLIYFNEGETNPVPKILMEAFNHVLNVVNK